MQQLLAIFQKSNFFKKRYNRKFSKFTTSGDGNYTKLPKTHRNHPSNQLQNESVFTEQYPPFFPL